MSVIVLVPGYGGRFRLVERWRVDLALRTVHDRGGGALVVSGHQGEAQRLAALVPAGVAVVEETTARSTFENVERSLLLLDTGDPIAIASDRFHGRRLALAVEQLRPDLAQQLVPPSWAWRRGWWMDAAGAAHELVVAVRRRGGVAAPWDVRATTDVSDGRAQAATGHGRRRTGYVGRMGLAQSVRHRPGASGAALVVSLVAVFVVAAIGGLATATGAGSWYQTLDKPSWNPPNAVFGPVWTVLYIAMAVAAWLVAREGLDRRDVKLALGAYAVQLALNLAWTLVFFGLQAPEAALVVIVALFAALVVTMVRFWRIVAPAGWLFVPYAAWVAFAATLNGAIVALN